MKAALVFTALLALSVTSSYAQDEPTWFDFWLGDWDVTWDEADGKVGRGKNHVVRILDNSVIQENFSILEGASKGYLGTSISVYNPKRKTWHQGYADSKGAYFNFIGERAGDRRIFKTEPVEREGKTIIQRMVFYDVSADAFKWDWESSEDGGQTWELAWRIHYTRRAIESPKKG
jgi:hypothetical protein